MWLKRKKRLTMCEPPFFLLYVNTMRLLSNRDEDAFLTFGIPVTAVTFITKVNLMLVFFIPITSLVYIIVFVGVICPIMYNLTGCDYGILSQNGVCGEERSCQQEGSNGIAD
jgi:ABC-type Fe3+-siderophore transport system permease subunit